MLSALADAPLPVFGMLVVLLVILSESRVLLAVTEVVAAPVVVLVVVVVYTHCTGIGPEGLSGHGKQLSSPRFSWKNPIAHDLHFAEPGFAA